MPDYGPLTDHELAQQRRWETREYFRNPGYFAITKAEQAFLDEAHERAQPLRFKACCSVCKFGLIPNCTACGGGAVLGGVR